MTPTHILQGSTAYEVSSLGTIQSGWYRVDGCLALIRGTGHPTYIGDNGKVLLVTGDIIQRATPLLPCTLTRIIRKGNL